MNKLFSSMLIFGAFLFTSSSLQAQDYSIYRGFSLGSSLAGVLARTNQKEADATVAHGAVARIRQLAWWPPNIGTSDQPDSVEQILFSFHDGALYKMSVTYDQTSTAGLTVSDMEKSISSKYGPATSVMPVVDPTSKDNYDATERLVASWEDAQNSFNLVRSFFSGRFGLIIYSKQGNAEAKLAIAEARTEEKQNGPKRAADRAKKQADDLQAERMKNQKAFRP